MSRNWNDAIVTEIQLVMHVTPSKGKAVHINRPFHGLVINDGMADKLIVFEDGTTLRTRPNELHYLPKGSNYRVKEIETGGCYAINFDLLGELGEKPFSLLLKDHESVLKRFKEAVSAWNQKLPHCNVLIRKCIYDIIVFFEKERQRSYLPSAKEQLIQPAVELIAKEYMCNTLTVGGLAKACNISEAYFRRLFFARFSTSPKEYIIRLRIERAKQLLASEQFSVSEVAELCGYLDLGHFSREFRKNCHCSPREWNRTES